MQRLEVSGAVRPIYGSLGVKRLSWPHLIDIMGGRCHCSPRAPKDLATPPVPTNSLLTSAAKVQTHSSSYVMKQINPYSANVENMVSS